MPEPRAPARDIDLAREGRAIGLAGAKSAALCTAVLGLSWIALPRVFDFPEEQADAIAFALKANLVPAAWLAVAIGRVSRARRKSREDIGAAAFGAPTPSMRIKTAFLQNTLEQAALFMAVSLGFAAFTQGAPLALVAGSALLFAAGRALFWRGYEGGAASRAFGMVTTTLPSLLGLAACAALAALEIVGALR